MVFQQAQLSATGGGSPDTGNPQARIPAANSGSTK